MQVFDNSSKLTIAVYYAHSTFRPFACATGRVGIYDQNEATAPST